MSTHPYEIESGKPFSQSILWQLNRDFYQDTGIAAWSNNIVPHNMTSSSFVGKTYAELIFAFLKDLAKKGGNHELVYILELGAGHGRLAFHILKHLEKLEQQTTIRLPKYCYVLSDIVEENLSFFLHHRQLQTYFEQGKLDVCYFDAIESKNLQLQYSQRTIEAKGTTQPIIAIANYFFDSLPNDLFHIKDENISSCSVSIHSDIDLKKAKPMDISKHMSMTYHHELLTAPFHEDEFLNDMLQDYKARISESYLFFPTQGIRCLNNIRSLSTEGLMLLTMDKGYHELKKMNHQKAPDIISHGSFSLWVNYHALGCYCNEGGGKSLFPMNSNFHLEIGCLLFLSKSNGYDETVAAYEQFVNNFGPDDYNSIKKLAYANVAALNLKELIALFRLSNYDSGFFIKLLPRLKQLSRSISVDEKDRLVQTVSAVWDKYFDINESFDLAFELGGICYDLGQYRSAIHHFQYSMDFYGEKADLYHNQALCYYELREDKQFYETIKKGQTKFPDSLIFQTLLDLEMA